jgi:hypothetical protein
MALGGREAMYYSYKKIGSILLVLVCLFIIFLSDGASEAKSLNSKSKKKAPQARLASYASSTILTNFLGPDDLGPHSYRRNVFERNGIVYTTKAGHIDIAHVRKFIDWTAFLTEKTYANLMKNKTELKFKAKAPSIYHVEIVYPAYWKVLSEKKNILLIISPLSWGNILPTLRASGMKSLHGSVIKVSVFVLSSHLPFHGRTLFQMSLEPISP